jgi:hypothetical protein
MDLEQHIRIALTDALGIEAYDVAGHLLHALHAHTAPRTPLADTVRVPLISQTRSEAPRTAHPLCICPRNDAGRVGTDPGCPIHQPGAAGLHAVPTERIEPPAEWHRHAIEVDAGQPYRKWEPGPVHPGPEEACRLHPAQQAVSEQPEA